METILFAFVGLLCLMMGVRVIFAEEQTKVFNKRNIPVTDVKKYNRACGGLIIGFGAAAEITLFFMFRAEGWLGYVFTLGLIVEAMLVVSIYSRVERHFIQKRDSGKKSI